MCKLLIGVQNSGSHKQFENAIRAQFSTFYGEKDGIGALAISKDGKVSVMRSLENYHEVINFVRERMGDARLVALHSRTGTSGGKTLENVHFFEADNHLFAHNGFVMGYHSPSTWYSRTSPYSPYSSRSDFSEYSHNQRTLEPPIGFDANDPEPDLETIDFTDEDELDEAIEFLQFKIESCKGCSDANKGYCKRHKRTQEKLDSLQNAQSSLYMGGTETNSVIKKATQEILKERDEFLKKSEKEEKSVAVVENPKVESNVSLDNMCDSYQFLYHLSKPITTESLEETMAIKQFSGMGFLLDKETLNAYILMRNKEAFVHTDEKNFAVYYSFDPNEEMKLKTYSDVFGVSVLAGEKEIKIELPKYKLVSGAFRLSLGK